MQTKIGIIGGSGIYDMEGLQDAAWVDVGSPWGTPSDAVLTGTLDGVEMVFLPRHGRGHVHSPTTVPYRANIDALKRLGVTDIISISACGSFKEELAPGDFVIVDQFIDRTFAREKSFFGTGCVAHVSVAHPTCDRLSEACEAAGRDAGITIHRGGTYLAMEGPQFSSVAESKLYREWGCDVIGMTNMPEAKSPNSMPLLAASFKESTLMKTVQDYIRTIPDFPHEGIMFRDVTTLFSDPRGFRIAIDQLLHPYAGLDIDKVVGLEARGFILGGAIAHQLSVGFIPIRKKGKLPGKTIEQSYTLEYGEATMEVHDDALQAGEKVLMVDDLLATGGTAEAGIKLVERMGAEVIGCAFIIDLPDLGGRKRLEALNMDVHALCAFDGD